MYYIRIYMINFPLILDNISIYRICSSFIMSHIRSIMSRWRKKHPRCVSFDSSLLICECRWPLKIPQDQLEKRLRITLTHDELQTLVDRDIEGQIMDDACQCMGISKTVYAGIYASARNKVTRSIIEWAILMIECNHSSSHIS